ncbi:MAG: hypothetical protein IJL21_00915 [Alphaproteobacteria bacterium]|nr:hypothetical protein [Alphaproteobacteria bacterium]
MSNVKVSARHEHEEAIALYCAKNNIEFNQANAYDVIMKTFESDPIMYKDDDGTERNGTARVAWNIEQKPKAIERIADKIERKKNELYQEQIQRNIEHAKVDSVPDLDKLVDNLYRLNIVDENSYLALVCFLMQLKYSRDSEILENDKTCVFFNGIARNGKSATAKAICDVESQFGTVFKAQTGKLLEAVHEEQVWKSHLNYFDEVKPTDIDRELLLTIVNGGNVEINPKNKRPVNFYVNTNNIFTSNDLISLKQRRVSVVKFGDRLNGRPLAPGTLNKIITDIFNSLPTFDHYYDLYDIVSIYNENRMNPLAISNIITFMTDKLGFVNREDERTLTARITFAPHDIYACVKDTFSKQILSSERKDAIKTALDSFKHDGLIDEIFYNNCSTRHFAVTGEQYLAILERYNDVGTKDETNEKISHEGLRKSLARFFEGTPEFEHICWKRGLRNEND